VATQKFEASRSIGQQDVHVRILEITHRGHGRAAQRCNHHRHCQLMTNDKYSAATSPNGSGNGSGIFLRVFRSRNHDALKMKGAQERRRGSAGPYLVGCDNRGDSSLPRGLQK